MNPHIEKVILMEICRGHGTDQDPVRMVVQVRALDGTLIAERDPTCPMVWSGSDRQGFWSSPATIGELK